MLQLGGSGGAITGNRIGIWVVSSILLLIFNVPAFAQVAVPEESTKAEVEIEHNGVFAKAKLALGVLNGESRELVYNPYMGWKVSELVWELNNVYMLGGEVSIRPLNRLGLNLAGWMNVNEGDGDMDNYDWLVEGVDNWTDWSHHENTDLKRGTMLDLSAEFFIIQKKKFTLSAIAGYKRNNWKWKAYGGTFIYSVEGLWDTIGGWPDGLLGISYEQWWDVPYIGVGLAAEVGPFEFDCRLIGSTIVDAEDEDHHHLRSLIFKEKFEDGEFIGVKAGVTYNITSTIGVGLDLDYQNFEEVKGGMIVEDTITGMVEEYTGDITGADNELIMVALGVQFKF